MTLIACLSLAVWVYLLGFHGRFWQAGPGLPDAPAPVPAPAVAVIVPARDEAEVIGQTLRSLLAQDYPNAFRVILVDDNSTDGTGAIARALTDSRLSVITGAPRPPGWSGKLWAVHQGIAEAEGADLVLLTDADIIHAPGHLRVLVAWIERQGLDMASEMVRLACNSLAEKMLVPAFVFFFQLLYPFDRVNDGLNATAAAAGGTILIRAAALRRIGGIKSLKGALIDDVALAGAVKKGGRIWLGHATLARSVRPYPRFGDIWRMITRTAYVQLRHNPLLLALTTLAMAVVWLVPPFAAILGSGLARIAGALAWVGLTLSYIPILRLYNRAPFWALLLPWIAIFYMAATIGSALNFYTGRGVAWKGRAYGESRG